MNLPRLGHVVTARLLADDSLSIDNRRSDVALPFEPIRVGLRGRTNVYVQKALAANSTVALEPSSKVVDVIVCGCAEPPPTGNILLLPGGARTLDGGLLAVVNQDHPIASNLSFAEVAANPTAGLASGDVVVRAGGVPAVVAFERDGRRIVDLRFEPDTDTAVSTSFPILIANAIRWLDGRRDTPTQLVAGEPLQWTAPAAIGGISVSGPDGNARAAQIRGRSVTVVDTGMPGIYTVRSSSGEHLFAVNPVIDGESDLRRGSGAPALPAERTSSSNGVPMSRVLLLVAAVLVTVEWFVKRRRPLWRAAIAACLAAGAAGIAVWPNAAPVHVVAVLDRSGSILARAQHDALDQINTAAATLRHGDRLDVVGFGAEALVETRLASSTPPEVGGDETDIGAGLRLARTMLLGGGSSRVVLVSDGRQTVGDAEREAAFLAADGVRIDVSPIDTSRASSLPAIGRVVAPADARINEPFPVAVEIHGSAGGAAQLTLQRDGEAIETRSIRVPQSGTDVESFSQKESAGMHVYRAVLTTEDADTAERPSGAGAVVSVSGEPRVLYVSRSAGVIRPALTSAGFVSTHVAPDLVPHGVAALSRYDAIVLDDVSADELGAGHASDIARYVEQFGGGLLLLGGSRTLDITGYPIGPLGSSLPVDLRRRSGHRSPSFGLALVFDKSGSMSDDAGGASKIELARQAVVRVLDVLPSTDSLGVIAFDAKPVVVTPLVAGQQPAEIAKKLQTIAPGGSTRIAPAASLAVQWLNDPTTKAAISRRQILLISDGQTSPDDAEQLLRATGGTGVEVSAVAIGANANRSLLQQLADSTGGRAYFPADLADLPKIVAREAVRSRSGDVVEEPFALRGMSHPVLAGLDRAALPRLSGYVVASAKPTAVSILTSHLDDPILCAWQFGLGRVAVFTGDLESSWSAKLRAWRDFGRLWVQSTRWVSRSLDDRQLRLAAVRDGRAWQLVVNAERADGSPIDLVDARATVRRPDASANDLRFEAFAPGRYVAHLGGVVPGAYTLSFTAHERDGGVEHRLLAGVFRSDNREQAALGPDDELLRHVAAIGGGRVLAAGANPFAGVRPTEYRDVSTWLTAAALFLYLAELLVGPWLAVKWLPRRGRQPRRSVHRREAA
jgi:uncharacterized membrane protein/Mg-chelatase subunit ChlD